MAAHDSLSSDQFEHLGDRGVRIGERTFPSIDNGEFKNSGRTWMRSSMIPMENGSLANVEHHAEGFTVNAPRHQLGVGGNPNMRHLFDTHPQGKNLQTPEAVHGVLDDISHQPLSQDSVQTNRTWMGLVRKIKDDEANG
jgi:hypothetical protein